METNKGDDKMELAKPEIVEGCKCKPVKDIEACLKDAKEMKGLMDHAYGIAAPQVGIFRRFFLMKSWNNGEIRVIINPEIIKESDKQGTYKEGCLTYPGETFYVKRPKQIRVKWYDPELGIIYRKLTGKEAQVFHHEFQHLDGITIKNKRE